jgi:transcriptional regulator with GAF, ATPase, and Fis domain
MNANGSPTGSEIAYGTEELWVVAVRPINAHMIITLSRSSSGIDLNELLASSACCETKRTEFGGMIGSSQSLWAVLDHIRSVAATDFTVLIQGETGTGKELTARAIHNRSFRSGRPFITLNCAAIPVGLLENELFGRDKGAFTGAVAHKSGRFEALIEARSSSTRSAIFGTYFGPGALTAVFLSRRWYLHAPTRLTTASRP